MGFLRKASTRKVPSDPKPGLEEREDLLEKKTDTSSGFRKVMVLVLVLQVGKLKKNPNAPKRWTKLSDCPSLAPT